MASTVNAQTQGDEYFLEIERVGQLALGANGSVVRLSQLSARFDRVSNGTNTPASGELKSIEFQVRRKDALFEQCLDLTRTFLSLQIAKGDRQKGLAGGPKLWLTVGTDSKNVDFTYGTASKVVYCDLTFGK
ncbi:MAG: hypothetical protein WD851_15495 [Pirellulales bacterium]